MTLRSDDGLAVGICRAKCPQFGTQTLRAARGDVIGRSQRQPWSRPLPSAALRKIDTFFHERPAHSTNYRARPQTCVRTAPFLPVPY